MKIISVTLLIAFSVLFLNVDIFGHDPCQSEQSAYDDAVKAANKASRNHTIAVAAWSTYLAVLADKGKPPAPLTKDEAHKLSLLSAAAFIAYLDLQDANDTKERKKRSLDNCRAWDKRPCGCSIAHTQNITSCYCSYNNWNGWCHCLNNSN